MLTTLILSAFLSAAPEGVDPATVTFVFRAGDLPRARDIALKCRKFAPKVCGKMFRGLVDYQFLIPRSDALSLAEAKQLIALDRMLSPEEPGRLTLPILAQYVTFPLAQATEALKGQNVSLALSFVDRVLSVDPKNVRALELQKACREAAVIDAGR